MKKIIAVLAVVLVTGCSSMGTGRSDTTAGGSNMRGTQSSGSMDRDAVIKSNGNLSLYHGG